MSPSSKLSKDRKQESWCEIKYGTLSIPLPLDYPPRHMHAGGFTEIPFSLYPPLLSFQADGQVRAFGAGHRVEPLGGHWLVPTLVEA